MLPSFLIQKSLKLFFNILGWYRDCGVIEHTTGFDLSIFIEEFDNSIKNAFLGNLDMSLIMSFGSRQEGLEFRLHDGYTQFDLFFLTKVNKTTMWSAYHSGDRYFKY